MRKNFGEGIPDERTSGENISPKDLRPRGMRMLRRLDIVALCNPGVKHQYRGIYDRSISQTA